MKLNTPLKIGKITIKNRITFAPTVKFDFAGDSGMVDEKHIFHYKERAKGGCGLICVEATAIEPGGRFTKTHLGLWTDEQIDGHRKIVEACHQYDCPVIIQLNHAGYCSNPECGPAIGPSEIKRKDFRGEYITKELSIDEIHDMQQLFVSAAIRAATAGYDGVQLHGCHGYLINQFVSSLTNHRRDAYGGSIINRASFCAEIIRGIREKCGEDFLISVRTTGFEGDLKEAILIAEEYVRAGCEYLQVSSGVASLETLPEFRDKRVTDIQSLGVSFHEHFKNRVPVSCVGGLKNASQIRYLIEENYVDTVDVARAILADPEFANAVLENKEFSKCLGCNACQYGPFTQHKCPIEIKRMKKVRG